MDKFKRFRFFFYLPIIIIGLLCTIVFDWALYVQEEKTLQNWMQQIADAEILHLNRAMDRYINISAASRPMMITIQVNRGLMVCFVSGFFRRKGLKQILQKRYSPVAPL